MILKALLQRIKRIIKARSRRDLLLLIKLNVYRSNRLLEMMRFTTESMTSKKVEIYLQHPLVECFSGQAYKEDWEIFAIDIVPGLDLESFYHVWLHEAAHIILGHVDNSLPRNNSFLSNEIKKIKKSSSSGEYLELSQNEKIDYENSPQEAEARSLAYQLDHIAVNKALGRYERYPPSYETRIQDLSKIRFNLRREYGKTS